MSCKCLIALIVLGFSCSLNVYADEKAKEKNTMEAKTETLKVGDEAPDFELKGSDGKTYKLSDFKEKSAVIVAWYPMALTGGWTIECKSLRESGDKLRAFQVVHFGASCDPIEKNIEFAKKIEADYPLLSDTDKKVATAYGILSPRGFSKRVTFIIDAEGKIAAIDDNIEFKTHGADLAKKLEELKIKPAEKREEKEKASESEAS